MLRWGSPVQGLARTTTCAAETASEALPNEVMRPSPRRFTTSPPCSST
jgi:hypothetical protein